MTYTLINLPQGYNAGPCKWECQSGTSPWVLMSSGTGTSVSSIEQIPGTFQVRCTVVFNDGSGGHKIPAAPVISVTVPKPDGIKILSGDRVSTIAGKGNAVVFQVMAAGKPVSYLTGVAQERITNIRGSRGTLIQPDGGWVPALVGNDPGATQFVRNNSMIVDIKIQPATPEFRMVNVGTVGLSTHQDIRIVIKDLSGNNIYCPLTPGYDVKCVKDSNNYGGTYQMQHTAN